MESKFQKRANEVIFRLVAFLFLISLTSALSTNEVKAANVSPTVVTDSVTVGLKSSYYGIEMKNYIEIKDYNPAAAYGYQIADNNIAQIVKMSSYGYKNSYYSTIVGIKKGKTTITITETLNGVTNNIGKVSVKVVDAKLENSMEVGLSNTGLVPIMYINGLAQYKYKSADKAVATVDEYGYVTGKKIGKTTITVTQTLDKKTIKLGTITVNVKKASLQDKVIDIGIDAADVVNIVNYNNKATYTYTSLDKSIVEVSDYGELTGIKYGTAKVKVTETYQKKTRTVGTLTVNVVKASLNPNSKYIYMGIGTKVSLLYSDIQLDNIIAFDAKYTCEAADSSIVKCSYEVDEYGFISYAYIYGASLGQTDITIFEEYNGVKRSLGTVSVSVIDIPVQDLYLYIGEGENGELPYCNYYTWQESVSVTINCEPFPKDTTTPVKYTSSNESVIKIDSEGEMKLISEGKSTITITCGEFTVSFIAIVQEEE